MTINDAEGRVRKKARDLEAIELVGIIGFALFFAWMFDCFYWFFAEVFQDAALGDRDFLQAFVFFGVTLGYVLMSVLGKYNKFVPFKTGFYALVAVGTLLLPVYVGLAFLGVPVVVPVALVVNLVTGVVGGALTVVWLDACSRLTDGGEFRFTSFSLFFGGALFALIILMPAVLQVLLSIGYGLGSVILLRYTSKKAPLNERAPLTETQRPKWQFTKEIEVTLVFFGIVFGLCFVYLFNKGGITLIVGLLFVLPGAAAIAIISSAGKEIGITVVQRVVLCVTVLSCVATPFAPLELQTVTVGLVLMSWGALTPTSYALLVQKCKDPWECSVFRQIPIRLVFSAVGFFIGWVIATVVSMVYGAHSEVFGYVRLTMAVVLVVVFAIFLPDAHHHDKTAMEELASAAEPKVVTVNYTQDEIFSAKCLAAAEMFELSPRETDILGYLARGRNAAYLKDKLNISPHTVKSHIYSIYRKFDIHSQQKLMDFIEEYPLTDAELKKYASGDGGEERS